MYEEDNEFCTWGIDWVRNREKKKLKELAEFWKSDEMGGHRFMWRQDKDYRANAAWMRDEVEDDKIENLPLLWNSPAMQEHRRLYSHDVDYKNKGFHWMKDELRMKVF